MTRRTALINQIRAFLLERGIVFAKSPIRLREALPEVLENVTENLTPRMRNLVAMLWSEWKDLELQIMQMNDEVERIASSDEACRRLRQIPGIGPLTASALVASIGNAQSFESSRQLAAWMGLVPRQHSSGGKTLLLGISKRGDGYLRTLLVHGARSVLRVAERKPHYEASWLAGLLKRRHPNVAAVALANKNARIVWALLRHDRNYDPGYQASAA